MTSIETGIEIRRWQVEDRFLGGTYGAFSPDGKILALGFECGIQLWDPETGKRLDPYDGPVHIPQYLAVSDDARTIAVIYGRHAGQFLKLFDTETLQEKGRIDAPPFTLEQPVFSPDERLIMTRDHRLEAVTFTEAATGQVRFEIKSEKRSEYLHATFSPDGRLIVVSREGEHRLLDVLTFEPLMEFVPRTYYGSSLAFSANGQVMVTGDTSALLVWDLKAVLRHRQTSPEPMSAARLAELWADLAKVDARIGHRAMVALSSRPEEAIARIRSHLPASPPDEETFHRLVRELDDSRFQTREAASQAIAKMGGSVGAMIQRALKDPPSIEAKTRLLRLAEKLRVPEGDRLRWLRCVELLERIGTPAARATLELFCNISDPESCADAARSLERLKLAAK